MSGVIVARGEDNREGESSKNSLSLTYRVFPTLLPYSPTYSQDVPTQFDSNAVGTPMIPPRMSRVLFPGSLSTSSSSRPPDPPRSRGLRTQKIPAC